MGAVCYYLNMTHKRVTTDTLQWLAAINGYTFILRVLNDDYLTGIELKPYFGSFDFFN